MDKEAIDGLKRFISIVRQAADDFPKAIQPISENISKIFREFYFSMLNGQQLEIYLKKERHRKKYYRMMGRRNK